MVFDFARTVREDAAGLVRDMGSGIEASGRGVASGVAAGEGQQREASQKEDDNSHVIENVSAPLTGLFLSRGAHPRSNGVPNRPRSASPVEEFAAALPRLYICSMETLTAQLPTRGGQTAFNLARWKELVGDTDLGRRLASLEGRIETDRYGHLVMASPARYEHGIFQVRIAILLQKLLSDGEAATECPISTADG